MQQCESCGETKPFRWLGSSHNCKSEDWAYRTRLDWYQFDMSGLWPSDWPD